MGDAERVFEMIIDCMGCDKTKEEHPAMQGFCQVCGDNMKALEDALEPEGGLLEQPTE